MYIDESGDEGFSFGGENHSSEYFVLSAVIAKRQVDLENVRLVEEVRRLLNRPPKKPLHFRDLKHHHKRPYLDLIGKANLKTANVVVHKPSLSNPETFKERYVLYFYLVRYLLERVSWYCRDNKLGADPGDGTAKIIFSNRSGMSYQELVDYMDLLRTRDDVRIHWPAIDSSKILAFSSGKRAGLQIADAVAGSVYSAVEKDQYGFFETQYLEMISGSLYRHNGAVLSYGLKFFPWSNSIASTRFPWLKTI